MKRGQFNFVWIFAILAGGTILVLAIYGAMQTGNTMRYQSDSEAAKSISILTNPLQAGFADSSLGKISFQQESRLRNVCLDDGSFGKNVLSVASRSGIGEEWNLAGGATSIYNKYIFSVEDNEGFEYFVFSKPFEFPYKVSDLIFLMNGEYCFLNAPDFVQSEILDLGIDNVFFDNCSSSDERVCFGRGNDCDSIVYGSCLVGCDSVYDEGVVTKGSGEMEYVGSLMWGAIFSDKNIYDCNVERLMFRAGKIAEVFSEKSDFMNARNCGTNMKGDLIVWGEMLSNVSSEDLISLNEFADDIGDKNDRELCRLW